MIDFTNKKIKTYSLVGSRATFGLVMNEVAEKINNLMVLTADVSTSAGLDKYRNNHKDKYLDIGIAEQNMIGIAAGLSSENYCVFTTTFAPFQTMRCLEQIKVNSGYMKNKIIMVGLASGLVLGPLGYTHCCIEDLSIMRTIPNVSVISPSDPFETAKAILASIDHNQSVYIRLTGGSNRKNIYQEDYNFEIGKAIEISKGKDICIFANGTMLSAVLEACDMLKEKNIFPSVINVHTLKPLDKKLCKLYIEKSKVIYTVEEHSIFGGLSSSIAELNSSLDKKAKHFSIALPDDYSVSGDYEYLLDFYKLTPSAIANTILKNQYE